jgi:DNA-binding sugar fermentation-stimulating protein
MEESKKLLSLDNLIEGRIIKRPSRLIKTPYVADVLIEETKNEILGHTAALGCCGLSDTGASVLICVSSVSKSKAKNKENLKCSHTIYLSIIRDTIHNKSEIVGIHPKLAERLVENALRMNYLNRLLNIRRYQKERTIYIKDKVDSRFDFSGVDADGVPFIMEVKNVPLADYEDVSIKERKKMNFEGRALNSKVAYFPDGYRKKSSDPVSPRALKHIRELTTIKKLLGESPLNANIGGVIGCQSVPLNIRCIMCYVIQRTDVDRFQISVIDPEYREAVKEAIESGVEIITMVVRWTREGDAYFVRDDLPMTPL